MQGGSEVLSVWDAGYNVSQTKYHAKYFSCLVQIKITQ